MPSKRSGIALAAALLASTIVAGALSAPGRAAAQSVPGADPAAPLPVWERTLYKTLTYQAASNLSDLALYAALLGGSAAGSAGFVAVNLASAMALYYSHDYAWETLGPAAEDKSHRTVASKTVTYRLVATAKNFALGYAFGGSAAAATAFVAAGAVADTVIFVGNEYAWDAFRPRTATRRPPATITAAAAWKRL